MKHSYSGQFHCALLLSVTLLFASCGGGGTTGTGGTTAAGAFTFTIGGTISGLTGTVVLQNNHGDNLTVVDNGNFTFATPVTSGKDYSVTVLTQPIGQICSVSTGAGSVSSSNVSNVKVICSKDAYKIGGTVTGLTSTLVLQDNNSDNLNIAANGVFTFATKVAFGSTYSVSVLTQPTGQNCSIASGTGTSTANVANITITCATNTYIVGGSVAQLNGSMVLQNNATDNLNVSVNGHFNFSTTVDYGMPYSISVLSQPANQRCFVSNGTGSATADISNVGLSCTTQMGGAMQGIALSLAPTVSTITDATTFAFPYGITTDGTNLYVADFYNSKIYKIVIATGVVTTFAGTGVAGRTDGAGATASFSYPSAITTDGTNLYVADTYNNKIRKVVIATGVVSSLTGVADTASTPGAADGAGQTATFDHPYGITTDGTSLYVVDTLNNKIRKVVIATGVVTTLAGTGAKGAADGVGAAATFDFPYDITSDGTNLYVADVDNNKIRKIVISTGVVSSMTGVANTIGTQGAADGAGATAEFSFPNGITTDGTNLYVADELNNKIRKIVIATGVVSSLTGVANTKGTVGAANGGGATATFAYPYGITCDGINLYVADSYNKVIRKVQ